MSQKLKKELFRFLLSGITAVSSDCLSYSGLLALGCPSSFAKASGFVVGTTVTYILNKFWTFQSHEKNTLETLRFVLLYAISLGLNVGVNHLGLVISHNVAFAFLCAVAVSTVFNFIGLKTFVFQGNRT